MKHPIKSTLFVILTMAVASAFYLVMSSADAKRVSPKGLNAQNTTRIGVDPDGSADVDETITIDTAPTKRGNARRWLYVPDGTTFTFDTVEDLTSGRPERLFNVAVSREADGKVLIHWTYPPDSGIRTYVLRYRITGAVRSYASGSAAFAWSLFDTSNEVNWERVEVRVKLPPGSGLPVDAFGRAGRSVESIEPVDDELYWPVGKLAARTNADIAFSFVPTGQKIPPTVTVANPSQYPRCMRDSGLLVPTTDPARGIALLRSCLEGEARVEGLVDTALAILPILTGLGLVLLFAWLQVRFGREYKVSEPPMYVREIPTNESPAEVGWLESFGTVDTDDLAGTIVDLARRGYFRIDSPPDGSKDVLLTATPERVDDSDRLLPHESTLYSWLFPTGSGTLSLDTRKESIKSDIDSWQSFWSSFQQQVEDLGKSKGLLERGIGRGMPAAVKTLGAVAAVGGALAAGFLARPVWLFVTLAGAILMQFGGHLSKRSRLGAETYEKWMAFKRFIMDFSTMTDQPPASVIVWEEFLAYAIPLGEGKTVVDYMKLRPPTQGSWYPANPAAFLWLSTTTEDWKSAGTPSSSGGSSGGGFSGGGGGGFGGGGGASFD